MRIRWFYLSNLLAPILATSFWRLQKTAFFCRKQTILKHKTSNAKGLSIGVWTFGFACILSLASWNLPQAQAATGINSQINFQARLQNAQGATVPDGNYNIEFKIYQDGNGCVSSGSAPCGGTLKWTEDWLNVNSQGVTVKNGYFSVQLGSVNTTLGTAVDFNQDTLWLSLNIGNTASPADFASAGGDGEMTPFKRLAANPYALNSGKLGGLTSSQFVQLGQGLQADGSTSNASIAINKTGATANILQLQRGGVDVALIANDGSAVFKNQTDTTAGFRIQSATASHTLFTANTTNNIIKIGDSTGTDTDTTILQVDSTTADPTTSLATRNGGLFYNSTQDQLKVIEAGSVARVCTTTAVCAGYAPSTGNGYVQLAPSSVQVDSSTNNSIFVNKTGASGNIVEFQKGGIDVFSLGNTGNITIKTTTNSTSAFQIQNANDTAAILVDTTSSNATLGLNNPSFENNTSGWTARSGCTLVQDTSTRVFGMASAKCTNTATADAGVNYPITLTNGTQYTFSFYAKGTNGVSSLALGYSYNGVNETTYALTGQFASTQWNRHYLTFTPAGITGTPYLFIKNTDAVARTVNIDGVQIEVSSNPSAYSDGSIQLPVFRSALQIEPTDGQIALSISSPGGAGTPVLTVNSVTQKVGISVAPTALYNLLQLGAGTTSDFNATTFIAATSGTGKNLVLQAGASQTGDPFQIQTSGGTPLFAVTSGGNVGIGTGATAPTYPLSFGGTTGNKVNLYDTSGNNFGFGIQSGLLQIYANDATARVGIGYGNSVGFTETLTVKGANVGIGIIGPTSSLHVVTPQPVSLAGAGTAATQVLQVTGGKGGNTSGTTTTAGDGSNSDITAGAGGNATDATANTALAGTGGNLSFLSGAGGTNSSTGNRNGAAAGTISLTSGAGGNATGSGNNSSGGLISLQGGAAGTGGSGTAGSIGNISLQAAGGNVGIGTSSPGEKLTVVSADSSSSTNIGSFLANNLTQGIGIGYGEIRKIGSNANSDLKINAKGNGVLILQDTATGSVGIATPTPRKKLDVLDSTAAQLRLTYSDNSIYTDLQTDSSGNLTIDASGTKTTIADSLQVGASTTLGTSAGSGTLLTNNGATVNSTLALTDFATGGSIGTAANTVDKYTGISVAQTTASQALTIPTPTANTTYGRVVYVSNIGSVSFTFTNSLLTAALNPGATATLVWSNANGGASWTYAGADDSSILNQNSTNQTANFRISGSGEANTSFLTPLLDAAASATALNIGTTNANQINLNQNTTIGAAKTLTVTSALTSLTGATSGDALNVSNSTSSGNIVVFKSNATAVATLGSTGFATFNPLAASSGSPTIFSLAGPAHTGLTNAEAIDANLNLARTVTFTGGAATSFAAERALVVQAPIYAATTGTLTITDAATQAITGAPVKGSNVAITNTHALLIQSGATSTATNSYGLTVNAQTGATNNYTAVFLGGNVGIGTTAPTSDLSFGGNAARTIKLEANTANAAGNNLTVAAGNAGTGASPFAGGQLNIQGGNAAGTGNANGGNVLVTGGTGTGTGVRGLVIVDTPSFTTTTTDANCGATTAVNCTIAGGTVSNTSAVIVGATAVGITITMADPIILTAGRIFYFTAANGSSDFTLTLNAGGTLINIAMRANSTATLIWNGSDWTAAGASSSTTLQSAYDSTLTAAGGAEIILNNTASSNGLTVRNNATTPIIGGILEAQTSIGSNLFSVNNNANEYASNGGAETAGGSSTTFPANTWSAAPGGGTVARELTAANIATGQASTSVITTATTHGARNQLTTTLTPNLKYAVSYTVKAASASFTSLDTMFSFDGTASGTAMRECVAGTPTYSTGTASQSTTTITGVGTTWTAAMVGQIFVFANGTTARITAFGSVTSLTASVSQTVATAQNYAMYNPGNTVTTAVWSRVTCTFLAPASGMTSANSIFIRQTDGTGRTYYIDNLSVTVSADVNHAVDGSVDDATNFATNWTTFDADGGAGTSTITRDTATVYDTSGSAKAVTTAHANEGIRNNMLITPQVSTQYLVTFYAKASVAFSDMTVGFLPAGGSTVPVTAQLCTDYNTQTVSITVFTKITCIFTSTSSGITDPDLVIYQPTATARSIFIDALTVTLNTNASSNVQIGGANKGGPSTLLTLDRAASAPIAANNDAYLGSMYYDTTSGRIQCYEADGWGACGSAPDNIVNLNPEFSGAVLNGTGIGTMTADFCGNGGGLNINPALCSSGQARNFYKWTSPQATEQVYSIYVTYQLPASFKGFASDETVQLTARTDSTTNGAVTYEMFRNEGGAITACGTATTVASASANQWDTVGINGNEATSCGFTTSSANAFVIFKINVKAKSSANVYVGTLGFTTTGR